MAMYNDTGSDDSYALDEMRRRGMMSRPRLKDRIQDDSVTRESPDLGTPSAITENPPQASQRTVPPPSGGASFMGGLGGTPISTRERPPLKTRVANAAGLGLRGAVEGAFGPTQRQDIESERLENMRLGGQREMMTHQSEMERMRLAEMIAATQMRGEYNIAGRDVAGQYGLEKTGMQQTGATERTGMQQTGAMARTEANIEQRQRGLDQQYREFQSTDQYRRWKAQLDNDTRLRVAAMVQGKAPATSIQTAVFSQGGLTMLSDAAAAMQRLEAKGVFGQSWAQNKVEDWIFGAGLVDPSLDPQTREDIGRLRKALGYTSSATMRAHTGRTSQEIYQDFKRSLGPGQDWSALRGAMEETQTLLTDYVNAASTANINRIRGGNAVIPPLPPGFVIKPQP